MNCEQTRERLAEWLYGDVPEEESAALAKHVDECQACGDERAALEGMRQALDAVKAPSAEIDLAALYRSASHREQRTTRRWRRAALGLAAGLAASLLLVLLGNVDVRWESRRIVVSWGANTTATGTTASNQPAVRSEPLASEADLVRAQTREISARLEVLSELVHALAADVADRDQKRSASIGVLQRHLDDLRRSASQAWAGNQRDIEALYAAQFGAASAPTVERGE